MPRPKITNINHFFIYLFPISITLITTPYNQLIIKQLPPRSACQLSIFHNDMELQLHHNIHLQITPNDVYNLYSTYSEIHHLNYTNTYSYTFINCCFTFFHAYFCTSFCACAIICFTSSGCSNAHIIFSASSSALSLSKSKPVALFGR